MKNHKTNETNETNEKKQSKLIYLTNKYNTNDNNIQIKQDNTEQIKNYQIGNAG